MKSGAILILNWIGKIENDIERRKLLIEKANELTE
jgi:hypothetical protein